MQAFSNGQMTSEQRDVDVLLFVSGTSDSDVGTLKPRLKSSETNAIFF
jgi:hypothetical protein